MLPHPLRLMLSVASILSLEAASATLDIYWIDSEGGGSTLIVTPEGETVLIDSGNAGVRDPGRIRHVIADVAHRDHLDHCITTHFHSDHMGGAPELAALIPMHHLWDNGLPETDPDGNAASNWPLVSKSYRSLSVKERHRVQAGTLIPLKGPHLQLACVISRQQPWTQPTWGVHPRSDAASKPPMKDPDGSDNANSSAWVLTWGRFRFYDGGDLTWNTEAKLVSPAVLVPEVDIYQVTHHGLDVSNHPWLLEALHPTVSVMNNGSIKGTAAEVIRNLGRLSGLQAQYQVHKNLRPNEIDNNCPDDHIANRLAQCSGDFIHCQVRDDGTSYVIEIPSSGHRASYTSRIK